MDLKLEHPDCTHRLSPERGEERVGTLLKPDYSSSSVAWDHRHQRAETTGGHRAMWEQNEGSTKREGTEDARRDEKNHSPLQVEVSPGRVTPQAARPRRDLSASVSGIQPSSHVRSRALHPCVRGLGTALSPPRSPLPVSVRPPSSPPLRS
ncbi:hypothetical protein EYF80_009439 [Liparis tanakae]|uniref:Uncharacterized protein n=1 Tax=Liparis tanakae TaxID=230148 RepID=A0A4Z2IR61_9TELE|nr:hypothetical protein EYF80_009439 [Liparis tanakae]